MARTTRKTASKPLTQLSSPRDCKRPFCPAGIFALARLPCGVCVIVKALTLAHEKAEALRRIGIREGSRISLLSSSDPLLVAVGNSRIALGHDLARQVQVEAQDS